ncbi:hypothetical protein N658DRAFT_24549 [Parathielavia hyrcaniae]|uniref:Transcription regulator Rua1 C-terminal domain-containing protein n=1 Tax=Parathielavia hyrcaniae TaxID=113614 RepID=A0AAN6QAG8_9PEZI|nr:hypothetical protein N658DRAFT_24549 [Parathielavia hyrcaniae]
MYQRAPSAPYPMMMDSNQGQLRYEIQIPSFTHSEPGNKFNGNGPPPQPGPMLTMDGNATLPPRTDSMLAPHGHAVWTTPTSEGARPRPATIHEGFSFCVGEGFGGVPAWDSSALQMPHYTTSAMSLRPISVHHDFYPATTMGSSNAWARKPCDGSFEIAGFDSDMIGQAYTTDEAVPIHDIRSSGPPRDGDSIALDGLHPRRMSGSSFTVSTSGGLSEMTSYDDFSTALSDAPSLTSDYPPPSNRTSLISSTQLSPVASPRMTPHSRSDLVRTQSRGRASPSPRPGVRAAPYSVESARNKRWSTGSYGTANRRPSPFVYHHPHDAFNVHARLSSHHSSPTVAQSQLPLSFGNLQAAQQHPYLYSNAPAFHHNNGMLLPSQLPPHAFHPEAHQYENPPPLLSHGLFRMLQSNADPHSRHSHYTDLSDPPDLYGSLHEEQLPPPPEDMKPSDPDLVPHEQELRFEGDLYTPRWVRGHGNKREGWCGICKPGRWLVLKNSAFWYDKSFTHGISAATGSPFQEPQETRRMDGNPDVWEGLCGSCNEWIALVSSKKKGTTWFRHAYKCHTHPKVKDAPKRRRESSNTRALAATTTTMPPTNKPRPEPLTPQMTPAVSAANTPTLAKAQAQIQIQTPPLPCALQPQPPQPPQPQSTQEQQQQQQQQPPPPLPVPSQQSLLQPPPQQPSKIQLQPPPMPRHHHQPRPLPPQLHTQAATAPPPRSSIMSPLGPPPIGGVGGLSNMI